MKIPPVMLILAMVLIPTQVISSENKNESNVITIYGDQVTSAVDIEAAIIAASAKGTRPGIVILDGSKGPFRLTTDDKSVNIFVSDLILRGKNNAIIAGCDDGLFFDDFDLKHILIEEIVFQCTGDGVDAPVSFEDVTIRNNLFQVGATGILIHGFSSDWMISNNTIQAGDNGIWIINAENMTIFNNRLAGNITGIDLQAAINIQMHHNVIYADVQGVFLEQEAWNNVVQGNSILGVHISGIVLAPDVTENRVLANKVLCAAGATCQAVNADDVTYKNNKIAGNRP